MTALARLDIHFLAVQDKRVAVGRCVFPAQLARTVEVHLALRGHLVVQETERLYLREVTGQRLDRGRFLVDLLHHRLGLRLGGLLQRRLSLQRQTDRHT